MPSKTGIKNRLDYLNRVIAEDKKIAGKDIAYAAYLEALTKLVSLTDEVYENGGNLTKDSYEKLVKGYLDVTEKANGYKVNGQSQTRINVVNHIQKIISRDIKVLNNMDKENPGKIADAFEASRTIKVNVPADLSHRVGGQMSDRFPMVTADGKKGFFTARTNTAQDKKWNAMIDKIAQLGLDEGLMERINELRTDQKLRSSLQRPIYGSKNLSDVYSAIAVRMGFFTSGTQADNLLFTEENKKLLDAIKIIAEDGKKLVVPYNLSDRLGYDPYTRNDNKNTAMYEVAKFLKCEKLIAKATPMVVVNGKEVIKGTFMEHADGSDLANLKADDPLWNYNYETSPYNKDLYRDLADMQVIDYICGNVDRHKGNMCYKTTTDEKGNVQLTGIVGIDNDACFPEGDIKEGEFTRNDPRIFKPENFRFINKQTAEIIRSMTRAQLETILRGYNLTPKAIDKAWERTTQVKEVLKDMEFNNLSYTEDIKYEPNKDGFDPNNPFFEFNGLKNNPSIFVSFDRQMRQEVAVEKMLAMEAQRKRKMAAGKAKGEVAALDMEELAEFKKSQEGNSKSAEGKALTQAQAIFADSAKIEKMDALMKRINRLKSASKEFAGMRNAMYAVAEYSKELSAKAIDNEPLTKEQVEEYGNRLNALKEATANYIKEKGLTPKTEKGRERLEGAMRLDHGIEDLLKSFEDIKTMDVKQTDDPVFENEIGMG